MEKVAVDFIPAASSYQVVLFKNGCHGVYDFARKTTMAAGMTLKQASEWANRRNYKEVWGI